MKEIPGPSGGGDLEAFHTPLRFKPGKACQCRLLTDIVAKVFLGWRTRIPRAADAFYARRGEGDHIVSSKIDHAPP
jgi:hypothetical protein